MRRFSAYIVKHYKAFLILSTIISFCYFFSGINSWKYSYVGDMWNFYEYAKQIIGNNYQVNFFTFDGVFRMNSVLASVYQAVFMDIFGVSNSVWRLSNIILIIPLSYFFYRWIRLTFDRNTAIISTVLLQFSLFLSTFFKIGYINPQALVLFVMALYFAALSGLHPTKRNGFILGVILGISFYIYLGPIYPLLVWPYLIPLVKDLKKNLQFFATLIPSYVFWLLLFLPNFTSFTGVRRATVLQPAFTDNSQILTNIGNNLLVFYKDFSQHYTHFIPYPYLDLVSQVFAAIGIIATIGFIAEKKYRALLLVYLSTVIVLGIINPYTAPPTSRGIMLVIFGFIFAAIGLQMVGKLQFLQGKIILPAVLCIMFLNVYNSVYGSFAKMDYTGMALLIKSMQSAQHQTDKQLFLVLSPDMNIKSYLSDIPIIKDAYHLDDVDLLTIQPTTASCPLTYNKNVLVFAHDVKALQWLTTGNCRKNNISYKVLSTKIRYY